MLSVEDGNVTAACQDRGMASAGSGFCDDDVRTASSSHRSADIRSALEPFHDIEGLVRIHILQHIQQGHQFWDKGLKHFDLRYRRGGCSLFILLRTGVLQLHLVQAKRACSWSRPNTYAFCLCPERMENRLVLVWDKGTFSCVEFIFAPPLRSPPNQGHDSRVFLVPLFLSLLQVSRTGICPAGLLTGSTHLARQWVFVDLANFFLGFLTQGSYLLMRSKLKQSQAQGPCLSNLPMAMLGDLVGIVVFPMPDSVTQGKETKIQQYWTPIATGLMKHAHTHIYKQASNKAVQSFSQHVFFPRASERRVLLIVGGCLLCTSSNIIISSSHLSTFSSSRLLVLTSSFSCPLAFLPSCPLAFFCSLFSFPFLFFSWWRNAILSYESIVS